MSLIKVTTQTTLRNNNGATLTFAPGSYYESNEWSPITSAPTQQTQTTSYQAPLQPSYSAPQPAPVQATVSPQLQTNIRDALAAGQITGDQAKVILMTQLAQAYGGYMVGGSPQFPGGVGQNEFWAALPSATQSLFANLSGTQNGQRGSWDPSGNFIQGSTKVVQNVTTSNGSSTNTLALGGPSTWQYVKSDGTVGTVVASSAEEAMRNAPNIAKNSGVQKLAEQSAGVNQVYGGGIPNAQSTSSMIDTLAGLDPFIATQIQDPSKKAYLESLSPEQLQVYLQTSKSLQTAIESGKVVNPSIQITPAQVAQFLQQAHSELDPYYQEIMNNWKDDLNLSLSRLKEDYAKKTGQMEDPFKQKLADQAESEAQAGTLYGSERAVRENRTVTNENNALDALTTTALRAGQDNATTAARKIGSAALGSIPQLEISPYMATTGGYVSSGSTRKLFDTVGMPNLVGDIAKDQFTNVQNRANQLESTYRANRVLDYSNL